MYHLLTIYKPGGYQNLVTKGCWAKAWAKWLKAWPGSIIMNVQELTEEQAQVLQDAFAEEKAQLLSEA